MRVRRARSDTNLWFARLAAAGRHGAPDWAAPGLAGLVALALYLPMVPPGVLEADPGEFQFVPYLAGIAHPTGYPLYCLLGWLWSRTLPFGSVAYRMNLFSAITAAAAVAIICRCALLLTPDRRDSAAWPAAAASAAAFAASRTFWSQSIVAEVYALHALLLAVLLWATLVFAARPARWWVIALAAGVGLAHHRTTVLRLPGVVAALMLAKPPKPTRQDWMRAGVALLAPLLLYAYLPLRAAHSPYLVQRLGAGLSLYDNSPGGLLRFVMGGPFGASLTTARAGTRLADALLRAPAELSPAVWLLAIAGGAGLWWRQRHAAALLTSLAVLTVAFGLSYDIGDVHVMYIPLYLVAALLASSAIARTGKVRRLSLAGHALTVTVAALVILKLPETRGAVLASVPAPELGRWSHLLAATPADAILVSNDRNEIMPLWYYQYVEGRRPDLTGLFPLIVSDRDFADLGGVLDRALAGGRPVYLIKPMAGLEVGYESYGSGALIRVLARWTEGRDTAVGVSLAGRVTLLGYTATPTTAPAGGSVAVTLYWQAGARLAEAYSTYVHVTRADGSVPWPGSDHRPGGDYYPSTLWRPGQVLRDVHSIEIPLDAEPGDYRLIAGMYSYPSVRSLGDAVAIGSFSVLTPR
jgi:hypothetical protein